MPPPPSSSTRHPPRLNRPSHHNSTTHAAFTKTVRNTLDAPLPSPPTSSRHPSSTPDPSSSLSRNPSIASAQPRFLHSAPLPRRGNALRRATTSNGWHGELYSAPLTPQSPSSSSSGRGRSCSNSCGSTTTTLVDGDMLAAPVSRGPPTITSEMTRMRHHYQPTCAFAAAAKESPHVAANDADDDDDDDGGMVRWREAPGKSVLAATAVPGGGGGAKVRPSQSAQRGYLITEKMSSSSSSSHPHQARPPIRPSDDHNHADNDDDNGHLDPHTAPPRYTEELYRDLGIIASLPSLQPRDHLASLEAMNDTVALWAAANPVAGMHVVALARKLAVRARFEGTLTTFDEAAREWMSRRRLRSGSTTSDNKTTAGGGGGGSSFAERMRRRSEVAERVLRGGDAMKRGGGSEMRRKRGGRGWEDVPLVLVLLYSEICDVDVMRMTDRKVREMLVEWGGRFWPVSDESLLGVMMKWGSERKGKVDVDPKKWRREDGRKVERVIEKIRGLGVEEVRRGDSLMERLSAARERRTGSVRAAKK